MFLEHSGRVIYITSECAETSAVKGLTEISRRYFKRNVKYTDVHTVRSFESLKLCQCYLQGKISWLTS